MVAFRKVVAGTDENHWWDNGANAIAFSRGAKGFVAINRESVTVDTTITTGMPAGTYCDIPTGGLGSPPPVGTTLVVDSINAPPVHPPSNTPEATHPPTFPHPRRHPPSF